MLVYFSCHVSILLSYKPRYRSWYSDNDTGFQVIVVWFPAVKREVLLFQSLLTSSALHWTSYSASSQGSVSLGIKQLCGEADPLPLSSAVVKNTQYTCSAHFFLLSEWEPAAQNLFMYL